MDARDVIKKLNHTTWHVQGFNGYPFYIQTVATNSGWSIRKIVGTAYTHFFYSYSKSRGDMYYDEQDWQRIGQRYFKKFTTIQQLKTLIAQDEKTFRNAYTKIRSLKNLETLTDSMLIVHAKEMVNALIKSVGAGHLQESVSFVSEKRLKEILLQKNALSEKNLQLLSSPINLSFLTKSQNELWEIKRARGDAKAKKITAYIQQFGWIESNYLAGKTLTPNEVIAKSKTAKHSSEKPTNLRKAKQELMFRLKFTSKEKYIVQTIEQFTKWQDDRKRNILKTVSLSEPIIQELAKRVGVSPHQFKFILSKEINSDIFKPAFIKKLKLRCPDVAFYCQPGHDFIYTGKDFPFIQKNISKENNQELQKLHGTIASKGIARGKVKICLSMEDIHNFSKGDILITSMTRPEYLPAMQKSSGIVTDEGGITSHAAIVSRELKKPCIIGTKIATKIFKDGDMVEVDANKGVARKIS